MKPSDEEQQQAQHGWLASLHDARTRCRHAIVQASVDVSDPSRALWPALPPEHMTREQQTVAKAHARVLDYAEHVEPYEYRCAHLWTEDFTDPHTFPDGETLELALSEIEEWADLRYEIDVGGAHELTGSQKRTEYRRVYLPTAYSRMAFRQLNECLEKLKLAADPPTPERTVDGPEEAW